MGNWGYIFQRGNLQTSCSQRTDCRILSPTVDEVAAELGDKAVVAKCNVDDCEDIAVQYGIRNIPTLLFFKDGQLADRTVGVVPKQEIIDRLQKLM